VKLICARGREASSRLGFFCQRIRRCRYDAACACGLRSQVGFDQELGAQLPLGTQLRDANGASVRLRDVLNGKAALLVPGYYGASTMQRGAAGVAHAAARSGLRRKRLRGDIAQRRSHEGRRMPALPNTMMRHSTPARTSFVGTI